MCCAFFLQGRSQDGTKLWSDCREPALNAFLQPLTGKHSPHHECVLKCCVRINTMMVINDSLTSCVSFFLRHYPRSPFLPSYSTFSTVRDILVNQWWCSNFEESEEKKKKQDKRSNQSWIFWDMFDVWRRIVSSYSRTTLEHMYKILIDFKISSACFPLSFYFLARD